MLGSRLRTVSVAIGGSDTQTVTTGADGSIGDHDRIRGYIQGIIGSIADGTSDIYSGASITEISWNENDGIYYYALTIPGAGNGGWTTLTIGSVVLYRSSATFIAGSWTWYTAHTAAMQAFGTAGSVRTATFA